MVMELIEDAWYGGSGDELILEERFVVGLGKMMVMIRASRVG